MNPKMDDEANLKAEINNQIEIIVLDEEEENIVEVQTETNEMSSIIRSPETESEKEIRKIKLVLYTGIEKELFINTETEGNVTETVINTNTGTKEIEKNIYSEKSTNKSVLNVDIDMENNSNSVARNTGTDAEPNKRIESKKPEKTVETQQVKEIETEEDTTVGEELGIETGRKIYSRTETGHENESEEDTEVEENLNKNESTKKNETEMKEKANEQIEEHESRVEKQVAKEENEVDESSQLMNQSIANPEGNIDIQKGEIKKVAIEYENEIERENEEEFAKLADDFFANISSKLDEIVERRKLLTRLYGENLMDFERNQTEKEADGCTAKITKEADKGGIRNQTAAVNTAGTSRQTEQIQTKKINATGTVKKSKGITAAERQKLRDMGREFSNWIFPGCFRPYITVVDAFGKRKIELIEPIRAKRRRAKRHFLTVVETIVISSEDEDEPVVIGVYKRSNKESGKTEGTGVSMVSSMKEQHMEDITARACCSSLDKKPNCTEPSWHNAHEGTIVIDDDDDEDDDKRD